MRKLVRVLLLVIMTISGVLALNELLSLSMEGEISRFLLYLLVAIFAFLVLLFINAPEDYLERVREEEVHEEILNGGHHLRIK